VASVCFAQGEMVLKRYAGKGRIESQGVVKKAAPANAGVRVEPFSDSFALSFRGKCRYTKYYTGEKQNEGIRYRF
jgi:hypothetical protein